jgi:hypothetical protein
MGISGALGTIAIAKQTGKGVAATNPTQKFKLQAPPSLMPLKARGRYAVTDLGRDPGPAYTSGIGVGGEFSVYMEPAAMALLWYLVLGANADSGAGPYDHTATPANDLPYCTIWRMVGSVVFEKYVDCKLGRLAGSGTSGNPFVLTLGVSGITATLEAADTGLAALDPAGLLFPELEAALKIDTVARAVHKLDFEVNNNVSPYQADSYKYSDIDPGKREVSLSMAMRFAGLTAFPDYQGFWYGAGALPRDLTPVVGTHAFEVTITRAVGLKQKLTMPQITYAGVPIEPDPGGDPIEIELACEVEKAAGVPVITVVSTDAAATV